MDMQGSRELDVTQQQAWDALNDPEVLKACIPGCDRFERSADDQYAVGMALKIGPVAAKFNGKVTLLDIVAPESYTIQFDGQGGVAGHGKGTAQVRLAPAADAAPGCLLSYTASAQVGGKIAQLGQRLIDGAAKAIAEDFFKRFEQEMQRRHPPPPAAPAEAAAVTGAGSARAGEVIRVGSAGAVAATGAAPVQPVPGSAPAAPAATETAAASTVAPRATGRQGRRFPVWAMVLVVLLIALAFFLARGG